MPRYANEDVQQILWSRGILKWKLRDYQTKVYDKIISCPKKRFVVNCSRRWGKTFLMCVLAIECALRAKNTNTRVKIATATVKNLEEFIIPAFRIILEDCPDELWEGWTLGYMRSKKKFLFPNGSEIQLIGLDKDPDGGRGNYCDLYILDEAGYVRHLAYLISSVISPMLLGRPNSHLYIISTPSSTPAHPFSDVCQKAMAGGYYAEQNIYDNTTLASEEIQRIHDEECATESDWLREYMCQHVVDENLAIIPDWKPEYELELPIPEHFKFMHRYVAMDLGVKVDWTAILFGYFNPETRQLVIQAEAQIKGPKMTTIVLKDLIRKTELDLWGSLGDPYRRIADNDNPLLLQDLGSLHGLYFAPTGKDELHAMVNECRELIKSGNLIVSPTCQFLIGNLRSGIWNDRRKAFERNASFGHFDHLAALIYMVRNLDKHANPIPRYIHTNPSTHYIPDENLDKNIRNAESLKKLLRIQPYKK